MYSDIYQPPETGLEQDSVPGPPEKKTPEQLAIPAALDAMGDFPDSDVRSM